MALSSLYPHAAPPQNNSLLSNPLAAIGALQNIQAFRSNQAVGRAFQGATDAQGNFNPAAAQSAIANDPAAALGAPEATTRLLAARGQNIANATAQLGLAVGQNDAASSYLTSLYGKNLSPDDVNVARTRLAGMGVPPGILGNINSPDQLTNAVNAAVRMRAGAGTLISPTQGASTAAGQPTVGPLGATVGMGARGVGISSTGANDITAYNSDIQASGNLLASTRPLEKALPLLDIMSNKDFGPASNDWARARSLMSTLGIATDGITNAQAAREEVAKYLNQYVQNFPKAQRSDEAQALAKMSSPNLDLTQPATKNLVKSVIGMVRQDATAPLAAAAPNDYNRFKSNWYSSTDSRAFEPMSSKADVKAYYDSVKNDPAALQKARDSLRAARKWGGAIAPTE